MKKLPVFLGVLFCMLLVFSFACFLSSCIKENPNPASITNQVNNLQNSLRVGDPFGKEGETEGPKGETEDSPEPEVANTDSTVWADLLDDIRQTYGNAVTGVLDDYVGVLADRYECSVYGLSKLRVYQDTEDGILITNNDKISGWHGKSDYLQAPGTGGNASVTLGFDFCIVPIANFTRLHDKDYAVLRLGEDYPFGITPFVAFQDNEDANNVNWADLDGVTIHKFTGGTYYPNTYGPLFFGKNTALSFLLYKADPHSSNYSLPSIGGMAKDYGVFGTLGSQNGYFIYDDEDGNNDNVLSINLFNDITNSYIGWADYTSDNGGYYVPGVCNLGINTQYFVSEAY